MTTHKLAFSYFFKAAICAAVMTVQIAPQAMAQDDDKKEEKEETPSIATKTEGFEKSEGLFTFYTDPDNGDIYMEIAGDQLGKEFIAYSYTHNGVLEAGHFRGRHRDERVIKINRYYKKLEFIENNTNFYFDPETALARAGDANISPAVLASVEIVAETPPQGEDAAGGRYLIKANPLFLSEALHQVKPSPDPDAAPDDFSVGSLSSARTRFSGLRNYPENSDVFVDYVYETDYPRNGGSDAVTDPRAVTLSVQHTFVEMPDDNYEPRIDDYRVGYFTDRVNDMTSASAAPYRDYIARWRLEKKDPDAPISDPIKPITWWIENTTPRKYRDIIRDAVLSWNSSFEKAGFSNAIVVNIQPDDADWDAGDMRYNVIRWMSSPIPPFGAQGPSFSNPRTGEVLAADVMVEYAFIINRLSTDKLFNTAASAEIAVKPLSRADAAYHCAVGAHLAEANMFAIAALQSNGASQDDIEQLIKEGLYYLMLHEVGHTLGLMHNMKATTLYGPREVHDASITQGANSASVMDYPAVNFAPIGVEQGDFYITRPGPYDDWAIEFGYRQDLDEAAREALLARSVEPELIFGNDADDMRSPGSGIDPQVNIYDLSNDPVAYGIDRIELVQATLPKLVNKYDDESSWQELVRGYFAAILEHQRMAGIIARQIGGVYVDRTAPGQVRERAPYTPVPLEKQKAAMAALKTYVFASDAYDAPADLYNHLQSQRRGFDFFGSTEDPKIHARIMAIQSGPLDHLLNPVVMQRMTDTAIYGGEYEPAEMIRDLTDAIYGGDLSGKPNAIRRNLQIAYLERLTAIVDDPAYDPAARAAALAGVENIRGRLGFFNGRIEFGLSPTTRAHRAHIRRIIAAMDAAA